MGGDERRTDPAPRLGLGELLGEVRVRIDEVRGGRDRLDGLLEAVLSVGRELDLPQVLHDIVEAAVVLVDAEYGALGVVGQGDRLAEFVPVGVSDALRAEIGDPPSGQGRLGELIRHPAPLRPGELPAHPASSGFPPGHPAVRSFLGVPIRVRNTVFGDLRLTGKRGGGEFDAEDEAVLSTLAVAAGIAVENARLFEEVRFRERWLAAGAEFTNALLSGSPESTVLEKIVERAREITGTDLGVVHLLEADGALRVALALGERAGTFAGARVPREGTLAGRALADRARTTTANLAGDDRPAPEADRWKGFGPAVAVPVGSGDSVRGVLVLARATGRPPLTDAETRPLSAFADHAALALELADRRRDTERMTLLTERERIARDLHDLAIQRLFATGMTLQSARRIVDDPRAVERLVRAIDDLDETIKIIRSTIFGLRQTENPSAPAGLRVRTVRALEHAVPALGFTPALRLEGLVDSDVPPDTASDAVAVVGEALSNVARHARASRAEVAVTARSGELRVEVTDDGRGIGGTAPGRSGGLRNLAERAEALGGWMTLSPAGDRGTRLIWSVPISE
ncbi:GAF domain-containing sensor histidine kinase [Streptomyces sp. NPDC006798]|uniref:GAF domain-containing sensor histidine kinase n=1 Tax=Streptomyces sp. NPDC006798 TaxID=3155462 RepID=UPI0033C79496